MGNIAPRADRPGRSLIRLRSWLFRQLVRADQLLHEFHRWVMGAYLVLFVGMLAGQVASLTTRLSSLLGVSEWIGTVARVATYSFAALNIALVGLLFVARRWINPITADPWEGPAAGAKAPAVRYLQVVNETQLAELVDLADEAFCIWDASREQRYVQYQSLLGCQPLAFLLYLGPGGDGASGYSCVLPLHEASFRRFRLGMLDARELSEDDLPSDVTAPIRYLCLESIYLRRLAAVLPRVRAVEVLCLHMAILVARSSASEPLPMVIAEGLTLEGRRFLARYGFEVVGFNRRRSPIYQLDMSRPGILSDRGRTFYRCALSAVHRLALGSGGDEAANPSPKPPAPAKPAPLS